MQHITRHAGQALAFDLPDGQQITVKVKAVSIGGKVRLAVAAPGEVRIRWVDDPVEIEKLLTGASPSA